MTFGPQLPGRLKPRHIAFNFDCFRALPGPVIFFVENFPMGVAQLIMHPGCFVPYELPHNVTKPPIYDFVVQPLTGSETVVKIVLMPV